MVVVTLAWPPGWEDGAPVRDAVIGEGLDTRVITEYASRAAAVLAIEHEVERLEAYAVQEPRLTRCGDYAASRSYSRSSPPSQHA